MYLKTDDISSERRETFPDRHHICMEHQEMQEDFPCSEDGMKVSEAEYWEKYYSHPDFSYEWNNGYLEEIPMTDPDNYRTYSWFTEVLNHYLKVNPVAVTMGLEFGFTLKMRKKKSVRKPDLAVILNNNPVSLNKKDRSFSGIFDLCIESLSDSSYREIERDTDVKKSEYSLIGVREYYILDAKGNHTVFYRQRKRGYVRIRPTDKDIIRSQVLPGFQFRISDLYRQPSLEQMAEDKVYQAFILPFYQIQKQKAQEEKERAEKERTEKEKERKRADQWHAEYLKEQDRANRLAEKLREFGIQSP